MKKIIIASLFLITLLATQSCNQLQESFNQQCNYQHKIMKLNVVDEKTNEQTSAWFFIGIGGYSKDNKITPAKIRLYDEWNGVYRLTEKDLSLVMIAIDDNITQPYTTYDGFGRMTIHCTTTDWNPDININKIK
jgi:hypothetical protein